MSGTVVFSVATEAQLNTALAAIDNGGTASAANTAYLILLTGDFTLNTNITAVNLAAGDTLTVQGANAGNGASTAQIDGNGTYRGFTVNAGSLDLINMSLTAMSAPGGTGGALGGGGALYVGAGASAVTSAVTFGGDTARGGTPAGGAVFVAQGGTLNISGGSLAGSGTVAGNGIFIQGNGVVTLTNTTVTGAIADQTGAGVGAGAGSVIVQGAVTLGAASHYSGGTLIEGALTLAAPGAAGAGAITFSAVTGETLTIGMGDAPANVIKGLLPVGATSLTVSDTIDLAGIGAPAGYTLSAGNQLTVTGALGTVTLNLDPSQNFAADSFILAPDAATGTAVTVVQSGFLVASEADLNAALLAIDTGGTWSAPNTAYNIVLTAGFSLTTDLYAVNLAAGDTLTIDGMGNTLDGAGKYRGFFDYAGGLTLQNMTIQNAVASGGAGGSGALPGGGGAGLGGGLFVASGGAATLANVTFLNDSAAGGAAGAASGTGVGGGGGLGGAGGAGGTRSGGGGGIGLSATGGSTTGSLAGGAGIVVGASPGIRGTGNRPVGGAGGAFGGGGGAGGTTVTTGSGKGGGGSRSYPGISGSGGIGGGFGGGASGEAAGFGGGGSNSAGGWGGGGSGGAAGGFGGGSGGAAGGGLGAGGDVFVQQGGSLTIAAGSLTGGAASGGSGTGGGGSGAALGGGIFIQGTDTVTLAPAAGQTLTIGDVIADQAGSGGTGAASLILNGAGTVVLSASNSFSGGMTLRGGTLSLQAPGAAGAGTITFAYGTATTLIAGPGDVPGNVISGFLPSDVIDLMGIGLAASATLGSGDILTVSGGTSPVQLTLDPGQNFTGETFLTADDGHGGTLVTAVDINGDFPPSISGAGTVTGDDHTPLNPLAGVTVSDLDPGQTETVTLTLSSSANGMLSNLSGGTYDPATGVYRVNGSASAVTAALNSLIFTPTVNEAVPGQIVSTVFSMSATDGLMVSAAAATTVNITALNDAPVISGVGGALVEGYWNVPLNVFPTGTVADPDLGATEIVTFRLADSGQGPGGATDGNGVLSLSMPGFTLTETGVGTYTLSAGTPAAVTQAIDAIQFTAVPHPALPGYTITWVNMSVSDGIAPPVTASAEVLTGLPIFAGVTPNQTVTAGQSSTPFSTVSITDSAGLSIQGLTIDVFDSSGNYLTPTDTNGVLSGANLTKVGIGTYTLTPGSTQSVSAELDALVFTPFFTSAAVTTLFNLAAFDGATTSDNQDTSVTASAGPNVAAISGTVPGQSVADNAPIAPFSTVAVSDGAAAPADSATITLVDASSGAATEANGTLSGVGLMETSPGTYVLAATDPGSLSAELDAILFTPAFDQVAPGYSVTTIFALAVTDPNGTVTDRTTSVTAIPSTITPVIAGTAPGQLVADNGATIAPFAAVTITDANPAPSDSVVISVYDESTWQLSDADGTLSGSGLIYAGTGTYVLTASDPGTIAAALDGLIFTPTPGLVSTSQTATASFTLAVADNLAVARDYNTSVTITSSAPPTIALAPVAGTNSVNAASVLAGLAISGTTTGVEDGQTVWILVYSAAAGGYVETLSATVAGGVWSAGLTQAQAIGLGDGAVTVYAYATNLAGVTTQTASENITVNLAGAIAAAPVITPVAVAFGAMRVGAPAVTTTVMISDGTAADPDQSALSYSVGGLPAWVSGGGTGTLVSGASTSINLTLSAAAADLLSGAPVSVALTSLAPAGSGLTDATLAPTVLSLSAKVYALAVASLPVTAVNFGIVHVGDAVSQTVNVSNIATGALTDVLTGGFGAIGNGFTGAGTLGSGLAAGASASLTIGLRTTSSGAFSGTAALNLASHDADLANIAVSAGPIALTGTVDNYAVAALRKVSGTGTLTQSGTNYMLNLGTLATGAPAATVTLAASNAATGLADLLSGGFTVSASGGFTNAGFATFTGLGSGQSAANDTVTLSAATPGTFTETITLTASGGNASGYAAGLPVDTLTITGIVATPVETLTLGADTVAGGPGNDQIVAAPNTLSTGDNINGGGGVNTLVLSGGGAFNLTAPATLTGIQFITAQEGPSGAAQVVTLRSGLSAAVNVASDTSGDVAPGITIIGATNTGVINLGNGNDIVTLAAGERVNGGGGNNIFNVTAATIKSTINGGIGANTLAVSGGGSVTMGAAITGIKYVTLSGATVFTANATANLTVTGSASGGDTITLGAPGQSVIGGGANELIKTAAANPEAQISGLGTNSTLEITTGGMVTLTAATSVNTVKLDSASVLRLNGMAFITATGSGGADTIIAGGINQTLTGGGGADTLIGFAGGLDTFQDKASGLNGDTIQNLVASDMIDITDLSFAGATLTAKASGLNTAVTVKSGGTQTSFTLAGPYTLNGFTLASDGGTGTIVRHG